MHIFYLYDDTGNTVLQPPYDLCMSTCMCRLVQARPGTIAWEISHNGMKLFIESRLVLGFRLAFENDL